MLESPTPYPCDKLGGGACGACADCCKREEWRREQIEARWLNYRKAAEAVFADHDPNYVGIVRQALIDAARASDPTNAAIRGERT